MTEQALVPAAPVSIERLRHGYTRDQIDLIKRTVAKKATDDELELFLTTCERKRLDPITHQIHFVKRHNNTTNEDEVSIQTGIDGYRVIADRTDRYAGNDEPAYEETADGKPLKASVTVWKIVAGERRPFSASARWTEYAPQGRGAFMWNRMPYLMLAKCAEALALRKAFPEDLAGLYTDDEMHQADSDSTAINTTAREIMRDVDRIGDKHWEGTGAPPSIEAREAERRERIAKPTAPVRTRESLLASWDKLFTEAKEAGVLHGLSIDPTDQLDEMAATCQKLYVLLATEKRRQANVSKPTPTVFAVPDDEIEDESPLA